MKMQQQFLANVKESAEILGLPVSTIRYLYTYKKDFPVIKIRDRYYVPIEKAKTWLEDNIGELA